MDLDQFLLDDLLGRQEELCILPLVTLQLDHLAHLFILDHAPIAAKLLFQILEDLFAIKVLVEALYGGDTLAAVALLNADMDGFVSCSHTVISGGSKVELVKVVEPSNLGSEVFEVCSA